MLQVDQIAVARDGRTLLRNVSVDVAPGQILGILGANGAGKSTLLATLAGEFPAASGRILWQSKDLQQMSTAALARCRAVLPQAATLAFDLDVREVVAAGAYPFAELTPAAVANLVEQALKLADASDYAERSYLHLSGGEQQRVHLARVLVQVLAARQADEPRLLLLDEPTANLDPRHQLLLLRTLRQLADTHALAIVVILHDVNLAASACDQLLLLAQGHVVAYGAPRAALTPEHLQAAYDTPARVIKHPDADGRVLVLFDL